MSKRIPWSLVLPIVTCMVVVMILVLTMVLWCAHEGIEWCAASHPVEYRLMRVYLLGAILGGIVVSLARDRRR